MNKKNKLSFTTSLKREAITLKPKVAITIHEKLKIMNNYSYIYVYHYYVRKTVHFMVFKSQKSNISIYALQNVNRST